MSKVHDGTRPTNVPPLCLSCRLATVVRGRRSGDDRIYCRAITNYNNPGIIRVHVVECSSYDDARQPSRYDFEQIAWVLTTSPGRKIGFVSPLERERLSGMGTPSAPPPGSR